MSVPHIPPAAHTPRQLAFWHEGDPVTETFLDRPRQDGCEGILFTAGIRDGAPEIIDIAPPHQPAEEIVSTVKATGLSVWLHLTLRFFDDLRSARGQVGRLLIGGSSSTMLCDYADLKCQFSDRELIRALHRMFPQADGFLLDSVVDPSIFTNDGFYHSRCYMREFKDRYQYVPSAERLAEDATCRRDYYSTWEDLLFRLQSSVAQEIWANYTTQIPIIHRYSHMPGHLSPNPFRITLKTSNGVLMDQGGGQLPHALARSIRRYHPDAQVWIQASGSRISRVEDSTEQHVVDVAVVWNWDVLAAMDSDQRMRYENSLAALMTCLQENHITFGLIPPEMITTAEEPTESGGFRRKEAEYRCVIYPYASVLRQIDWEVLESFSLQGGNLIFYGASPQKTIEGRDIQHDFELLKGTHNTHYLDCDAGSMLPDGIVSLFRELTNVSAGVATTVAADD